MAQSYHIYLHNVGGGESSSPTKPRKSSKPTQPNESKEHKALMKKIHRVGGFLENPDSLLGTAKTSILGEAGNTIVGAIGLIAYNISMKVANESVNLYTTITGDISGQRTFSNVRNVTSAIFSPISTTLSIVSYEIQMNQQNERARLNQQLLGDSVINQNYNRKV